MLALNSVVSDIQGHAIT